MAQVHGPLHDVIETVVGGVTELKSHAREHRAAPERNGSEDLDGHRVGCLLPIVIRGDGRKRVIAGWKIIRNGRIRRRGCVP